MNIIPARGERMLTVGQTGSGKTQFNVWMLKNYLPGGFIYDTKIEPKFLTIPGTVVADSFEKGLKLWKKRNDELRYVVVRPPASVVLDPDALDDYLLQHYEKLKGVPAYIDEIYQFHKSAQCGPGLGNLLTRGRSRGITTIMSTQRPAWLSRFCVTESQKFAVFRLTDKKDRARLGDVIPGMADAQNPPAYHFHYFDFDMEAPKLFAPIPLDESQTAADSYTDFDGDGPSVKFI